MAGLSRLSGTGRGSLPIFPAGDKSSVTPYYNYDNNESRFRTEKIFDTTLKILSQSEQNNISSHDAALFLAEKRILDKQKS